uniref:(California timema) hypothetical protein n=1 Tax=Timema californicum TaxID=61474 RepID=A0A7R9P9Q5_TIMCA|nr:unnamed protein product [Timema californicum]
MLEWFSQLRAQNVPINGPMMQRKADEFTLRLVDEEAAVHVLPTTASAEDPNDPPPVDANSQPGPSTEPQEEAAVHVLPTAASADDPNDPPPVDANSQPGPSTEPQPCDEETWQRLAPDCTYEEYITADDDITVWGTLDADIIKEQQESSDEEGEEEMEKELEDIPTMKDVLKAWGRLLKST